MDGSSDLKLSLDLRFVYNPSCNNDIFQQQIERNQPDSFGGIEYRQAFSAKYSIRALLKTSPKTSFQGLSYRGTETTEKYKIHSIQCNWIWGLAFTVD